MVTGPNRMQTASSEVVRGINRRIVLNLLRTRQPISRADLSRLSGMQRSTISLIVEELVAESWVIEGPAARLPRGRRPTALRLNDERAIIGVDLRPGNTTVALSDVNGRFTFREEMPTPQDPGEAIGEIVRRVLRIQERVAHGQLKLEGVGISVAGRFDAAADRLIFAPNLKWNNVDLRGPVARATGLDVEIENAANACVLAAIWFDGMESFGNLVVVTVSQGIGAGILMNGRIASGANGMAGEFGHVPLDFAGPLCNCGGRGCWEVFASNQAAIRFYAGASLEDANIGFEELLSRADGGDSRAAAALERMAGFLGKGLRTIVAGLAPERILMIGELTRSWHRFGPTIEGQLRQQVLRGSAVPQVIPVHEGGQARLRGAVAMVLQKHFGEVEALAPQRVGRAGAFASSA